MTTTEVAEIPALTQEQALRQALGIDDFDLLGAYIKALLYGEPGAGKTYFGGTADDLEFTSPVLFIDIDGGLITIRHRMDSIHPKKVRTIAEMVELYHKLHALINPDTGKLPYGTVVVDNLSELQKLDMKEIMASTKAVIEERQDPSVPSEREWGISIDHIRNIVRAYRDLPCNVIFLAHQSEKKDTFNRMVKGPDLPGKLRNQVQGFLDIVGCLHVVNDNGTVMRRLQVTGTDTCLAKDRWDNLGGLIMNPTVPKIWNLMHGIEVAEPIAIPDVAPIADPVTDEPVEIETVPAAPIETGSAPIGTEPEIDLQGELEQL